MKMENRFFPRTNALACIVGTIVMAVGVASAFAQPNPDNQPRRQAPPDFQPGQGQRRQAGFQGVSQGGQFMLLLGRVLTEEQRASLREAAEAQREQTRAQEQELREARKEILDASLAEKFDEAVVRAKALEVAKLEAELTVLRAKALSQVRPPLSPEQIEKLKNPPPMDMSQAPGEMRPDFRRNNRPPAGPRDENDLPPRPKPDQ